MWIRIDAQFFYTAAGCYRYGFGCTLNFAAIICCWPVDGCRCIPAFLSKLKQFIFSLLGNLNALIWLQYIQWMTLAKIHTKSSHCIGTAIILAWTVCVHMHVAFIVFKKMMFSILFHLLDIGCVCGGFGFIDFRSFRWRCWSGRIIADWSFGECSCTLKIIYQKIILALGEGFEEMVCHWLTKVAAVGPEIVDNVALVRFCAINWFASSDVLNFL